MLSELFTYLTTSCPPFVRHMDYLYEAIAMRGRYQRNRLAWQPHLEQSQKFILASAEKCRNRNTVVVLGAGLLLDVPLEKLSLLFKEVTLLDIVFLPEVRRAIRLFKNVKLVQRDVTGIAETVYNNIRHGSRALPESKPAVPEITADTGLVVSLNILSQLWVMPRAYVLTKLPGLDEEQVNDWCLQIVQAHYDLLHSLSCDVCLIADREFLKHDRLGTLISRDSTIYGLPLPAPDTSWMWDIAPLGEKSRFASKTLHVGAWHVR